MAAHLCLSYRPDAQFAFEDCTEVMERVRLLFTHLDPALILIQRRPYLLRKMRCHVQSAWDVTRDGASTWTAQNRSGETLKRFTPTSITFTVDGQRIKGQTGLFFTSYAPDKTEEWFEDFQAPDFARAGNVADRDVVLPVGKCILSNLHDVPVKLWMQAPLIVARNRQSHSRTTWIHSCVLSG